MATYTGDAHLYHFGDFQATLDTYTISDVTTVDAQFTEGEVVDDGAGHLFRDGGLGSYVGSIDINGTLYPIFAEDEAAGDLNSGLLYLVTPTGLFAEADLPANLSTATTAPTTECFLAGTQIATPEGEAPVEDLQIGDEIVTAEGKAISVKWIGVQRVFTAFRPPERLRPVRIAAGALGAGLPRRNLQVTADHALEIDGLLINAGALVNGSTVDWMTPEEMGASFTVYHVETENHDLILAEGTPAETYIDYIGRSYFSNYAEYLDLYREERTIHEMSLPRISAPRLVPASVRARLAADRAS